MAFIQLIRVKQWIKNFFLFLPVIFDQKIFEWSYLSDSILGFFCFSIVASSVYIINDLQDIENDKKHPTKKHRPLASGAIKPSTARFLIFAFLIPGIAGAYLLSLGFGIILSIYFLQNLAYNFKLKQIAILDVSLISIGFVLRAYGGAVLNEIDASSWLIMLTFLLALFIALAKRRDDVLLFEAKGEKMRKVIDGYNRSFLDTAMSIMASVIIVAYLMYAKSPETASRIGSDDFYFSVLFVIIGLLRYLQITFVENNSGSPTELLYKDSFLKINLSLWLLSVLYFLYF